MEKVGFKASIMSDVVHAEGQHEHIRETELIRWLRQPVCLCFECQQLRLYQSEIASHASLKWWQTRLPDKTITIPLTKKEKEQYKVASNMFLKSVCGILKSHHKNRYCEKKLKP